MPRLEGGGGLCTIFFTITLHFKCSFFINVFFKTNLPLYHNILSTTQVNLMKQSDNVFEDIVNEISLF